MLGRHERAVVLTDEERRINLEFLQRASEGRHDRIGEVDEAGVHDGGVLALKKADAPNLVRERQAYPRNLFGENIRGSLLHFRCNRRKDRTDSRGRDTLALQILGDVAKAKLVQRRDLAPVELVAAFQHVAVSTRRLRRGRLASP